MPSMGKQLGMAIIVILLGFGLTQLEDDNAFYIGLGYGCVAMGTFWIVILLIKDIKMKDRKKDDKKKE